MPPRFHALLFDLDGTLVDSSQMLLQVMGDWARQHGLSVDEVMQASHGVRTEDTVAKVAPHLNAKDEARRIEHLEGISLESLRPIPGAAEFLASLPASQWAIVTSGMEATARAKLQHCQLPIPPVFITAESITHGKPAPDAFLAGAKAMHLPPAQCLVFEDADNGVNAAIAAGCPVIIIGDACHLQPPSSSPASRPLQTSAARQPVS